MKLDLFLLLLYAAGTSAKTTPFLNPGFFFDYDLPGQAVPIPVTEQCEMIHITWGRSTAQGANPTAPYYMQLTIIRTQRTFIQPFIIPVGSGLTFDWAVPFAPGTQYQICMFDRFGTSGGCQAMYTVIQNSTVAQPVCQNVTAASLLSVEGTVDGGPMSQYGFITQCKNVTLTVQSGKPPFTLTVAPALHPPYNITSETMDPITWTVSLSWAFPFFLSLVDSDGKTWANGPMHSGGYGSDDCLAPGTIPERIAQGIAGGAAIGSWVVGLIIGAVLAFAFRRRWEGRSLRTPESTSDLLSPPPVYSNEKPLPPIPYQPSLRPLKWLGLRKRQERDDSNVILPFWPSMRKVPLREPKACAQPLVIVRDDSRDQQSAYSDKTGSISEPPPSYIPPSSEITTS